MSYRIQASLPPSRPLTHWLGNWAYKRPILILKKPTRSSGELKTLNLSWILLSKKLFSTLPLYTTVTATWLLWSAVALLLRPTSLEIMRWKYYHRQPSRQHFQYKDAQSLTRTSCWTRRLMNGTYSLKEPLPSLLLILQLDSWPSLRRIKLLRNFTPSSWELRTQNPLATLLSQTYFSI